jgi:hypothetical protein
MAAPKYAPTPVPEGNLVYGSPEYVPESWKPDRPAEIEGRQPAGMRLGYQGPDQGYVLGLAERVRDQIQPGPGVSVDDAMQGSTNIALRRASLFGRAPVVYDVRVACTMWGWLDPKPPQELVDRRRNLFGGVASSHHYTEGRVIADSVPESTLRLTPDQVTEAYAAGRWRELTGSEPQP